MSNHSKPSAIRVSSVDVFYRRLSRRNTLKSLLISGFRNRAKLAEFHALKNFSLEVPRGQSLGIIGRNGAGKSTLLKLISGVIVPSIGRVEVNGRLSALIELGAGFVNDLTGRENLYFGGSILGLRKREMDVLLPSIIEFAELKEFIDEPLRSFSSGMQARLGFSLAVAVKPEILVVDEVLAVGDRGFQTKCMDWMHTYRKAGGTLLFVSHDQTLVDQVCDRQVRVEAGTIEWDSEMSPTMQ